MESYGGIILKGKPEELGEKPCPSVTLSTTNHTWTVLGATPGFRDERPMAIRLSHDTDGYAMQVKCLLQ
jgi:hypothetical protein